MKSLLLASIALSALAGCKSSHSCAPTLVLTVSPTTGFADHASAPPGDQHQFSAALAYTDSPGCAVPPTTTAVRPTWTVSNPVAVQISSAEDDTNGLATCSAATKAPVSVMAAFRSGRSTQIASAVLICR